MILKSWFAQESIAIDDRRFKMICQGLFYSKLVYTVFMFLAMCGAQETITWLLKDIQHSVKNLIESCKPLKKVLQMKNVLPPRMSTKTLVQQLTAFFNLSTCHKVIITCKPRALSGKLHKNSTLTRQGTNIHIDANLTLSIGAFFNRSARLDPFQ